MVRNSTIYPMILLLYSWSFSSLVWAAPPIQIGGEEEENDAMILRPKQVEEGPDGNIYILDSGDSFIKVYAPDGQYLRKLGGPGEGPGEFQRTDGASFGFTTNGNLFFTEYFGGHRWITIMDLNGDLVGTISPEFQARYGISQASSLAGGGFLVTFIFDSAASPRSDWYLYKTRRALVRIDSDGAIAAQISETEYPSMISFSPNGATVSLPFVPRFTWAANSDGGVIWTDGLSTDFTIFSTDEASQKKFTTELPAPGKVTDDDLNFWRSNLKELLVANDAIWWNRFGRVIEKYEHSLFETMPVLEKISSAPEGYLLVQSPGNPRTDQRTFWLLDDQGKIVSKVISGIRALHISDHFVLYLSENEDGSTAVNAGEWSGEIAQALDFLK